MVESAPHEARRLEGGEEGEEESEKSPEIIEAEERIFMCEAVLRMLEEYGTDLFRVHPKGQVCVFVCLCVCVGVFFVPLALSRSRALTPSQMRGPFGGGEEGEHEQEREIPRNQRSGGAAFHVEGCYSHA